MWPWGHAAVGYLCYTAYTQWRHGHPLAGGPVVAVLIGTLGPDIVDKTLGWYLMVLPSGRSLAHSLLTSVIVATVAIWLAKRWGSPAVGTGFAIGYVSHPFADALHPVSTGAWSDMAYLVWPLVPLPEPSLDPGILPRLLALEPTPFVIFEITLFAIALLVWIRDGCPGLALLRGLPGRLSLP